MKDIKVIFRGNKAPSGMNTNIEYMMGEHRLNMLQKSKAPVFDIEVIERPKPAPKPASKPKKKAKKEKE